MNRIPEEIQERCRQADIVSKSMLLQIVRLPTVEDMHKLIDKIGGEGMTREEKVKYLSGKQSEEAKALLKEMVAEKAVELPKKKEAEPAAKPAEARKLRSITVRVPAQVAETGEMTMINERADAALEYEMKRIEQLKQIVRCLVS